MKEPPQYAHDWFSPLRSTEVPAGKVTNFEFMGNELIAFRDEHGDVVVLDAHCPHFGAHMGHGGEAIDGCVRCPFHGLHYDKTGQCIKGDFVQDTTKLRHVKTQPWTVRETAASIFLWHGPDRAKPGRPFPIADDYFDGWTAPVTNQGRLLKPTQLFYPTENIVDIQHFYAIHGWQLNHVIRAPAADDDGRFSAILDMTWTLMAQSKSPVLRRLGKLVKSTYVFNVAVAGPGIAFSEVEIHDSGGLKVRNIILITPTNKTDCRIRVVASVRKGYGGKLNAAARRVLGLGFEDALSRVLCEVATKDFDGDEMVWTHRKFLERPRVLSEDGPVVEYRKWCQQFWPPDYLPEAPRPALSEQRPAASSS